MLNLYTEPHYSTIYSNFGIYFPLNSEVRRKKLQELKSRLAGQKKNVSKSQ